MQSPKRSVVPETNQPHLTLVTNTVISVSLSVASVPFFFFHSPLLELCTADFPTCNLGHVELDPHFATDKDMIAGSYRAKVTLRED